MFLKFFYTLKDVGIPVSPTSFLTLQKALSQGLINSLDEFYTCARSVLVKSERYFDLYDQVFAHHFDGVPLPEDMGFEIDDMARAMLDEWLKNPKTMANALALESALTAEGEQALAQLKGQAEIWESPGDFLDAPAAPTQMELF